MPLPLAPGLVRSSLLTPYPRPFSNALLLVRLVLRFDILQKKRDTVSRCLTDPDVFVSVHPLIWKMESLGTGVYRVFERVSLGPFSYGFRYKVTVTNSAIRDMARMNAAVTGLVRLRFDFRLTTKPGGGVEVPEDVQITSLLPVGGFMKRLLAEQHAILFRNIAQSPY